VRPHHGIPAARTGDRFRSGRRRSALSHLRNGGLSSTHPLQCRAGKGRSSRSSRARITMLDVNPARATAVCAMMPPPRRGRYRDRPGQSVLGGGYCGNADRRLVARARVGTAVAARNRQDRTPGRVRRRGAARGGRPDHRAWASPVDRAPRTC
jgi:hypothetical protein